MGARERKKTDIVFRLRVNVSRAIYSSLRKDNFYSKKRDRLVKAVFDHLPYTSQQLKEHIESLWEPWMNWENHGKFDPNKKTWQIDHIIAQSKLPFANFEDDNFKKLWALSNLRPLETIANIKKGNKDIFNNNA